MTNPSIKINRTSITEPSLSDLLQLLKKDIALNTNCHHIATIQNFDPEKQTVTATINYKKTYLKRGENGVYTSVLVDYPQLLDVPVISLQGGQASLTMPIAAGDECLILFNDRDIDNWFQTGQIQANASSRLHSFSDAFALIGVNSQANVIPDYDPDRASLNFGTTRVAVGEDKVLVENEDTTLNTLLQQLIDNLKDLVTQVAAITVTCAGPGSPSSTPINITAINAITTDLMATADDIAGLLE